MADDQLQLEVDWCLARLEEKLAGMDPYSRPAQEAAKVHRILKSSKAPVIKKRQAMRNMFGDYRAKMKAMEKKSSAALKKSKLVPVKEPSSDSRFLRRSTGAQLAHDDIKKSVTSATDDFHQLCVNSSEQQKDTQAACATESDTTVCKTSSDVPSSEAEFKFNFDGTECATGDDVSLSSNSGRAFHHNYFVIKPSGEEFRFNFTINEQEM